MPKFKTRPARPSLAERTVQAVLGEPNPYANGLMPTSGTKLPAEDLAAKILSPRSKWQRVWGAAVHLSGKRLGD